MVDEEARANLLSRAEAMVPKIAMRASQAARDRRIPQETIDEMQQAGFFRMLQPVRFEGLEATPNTFFDVISILAKGCMSTAWICAVQGTTPFILSLFNNQAQKDVWGDNPRSLIAGQVIPSKDVQYINGDYVISGRWPYMSGCEHCRWLFVGGVAPPGSPKEGRILRFLLPRESCEIIDTWDSVGLRGSGSHDVTASGVHVPGHRTLCLEDVANGLFGNDGEEEGSPLRRLPFGQVFLYGLSATLVGALRGMFDLFLRYGASRVSVSGSATAEDPVGQLLCAEVANAIDEMELTRRRNCEAMLANARNGVATSAEDRRGYKFQSAFAGERCALLASRLFKASGGAACYNNLPFGRILADIQTARQHAAFQYEPIGRNWGTQMLGGTIKRDGVL